MANQFFGLLVAAIILAVHPASLLVQAHHHHHHYYRSGYDSGSGSFGIGSSGSSSQGTSSSESISSSSSGSTSYVTSSGSTSFLPFTSSGSGSVSGSGTISRDGSADEKQYTVSSDFLAFVKEARAAGTSVTPKIKVNSDSTFTVTIKTSSGTKTLKSISKSLVTLFAQLFGNPDLKISVISKSGTNVNISVSSDSEDSESTSVQTKDEVIQLLKNFHTNPNLEVQQVSQKSGHYTITIFDGKSTKTLTDLPSKVANIIIYKSKHPDEKIPISKTGKIDFPIDSPSTQLTKTTYDVGGIFLKVYNALKKNPSAQISIDQDDDDDQTYTLIITINGKKKTYKNIKPDALKLLLTLYKNPDLDFKVTPQSNGKYTIVLPENSDKSPKTSSIPSDLISHLEQAIKNPNVKVSIKESPAGQYQLVINDGSGDKTYKVSQSLLPVISKVIGQAKHHKPTHHVISKDGKNPHLSIGSGSHKVTHPVDEDFANFLHKIKKNPDLTKDISYNVEPTDDDLYDIEITLDSKKHEFKDLPHDVVEFFINLINNPKTTHHTITQRHDKPEDETKPGHKHKKPEDDTKPGHKHKKPGSTKDVPKHHKPSHELTFDHPDDDNEIPFKVGDSSNHEPSSTTFEHPKTKDKPKHKPTVDHTYKPKHHRPSSAEESGERPRHHRPSSTEESGERPRHHRPSSAEESGERPRHHRPSSAEESGERPRHHRPSSAEGTGEKPRHHRPSSTEESGERPRHHRPSSAEESGEKPRHHRPSSAEGTGEKPRHHKPSSAEESGERPRHHRPSSSEESGERPTSSEEDKDKPSRPRPHHEPNKGYHSKEEKPTTIDLLNTVKNSPNLKISVKPTKPNHYDITVDDGVHKTTYPDITIKTLTGLIKVRNNKHLPFEILPSPKPGHVTVKVPDGKSPDTLHFPISPDFLEVTDILKNEPKTEVKIEPDNNDHFTITIKNGKKKQTLKDIPSDVAETLIRLRTDDTLTFHLQPGKDGQIELVVPKQQPKPVKTKLTQEILDYINDVKKNPDQTFDIKPGKSPNTLTILLNDGSKTKTYPDLPIDLIPNLSKLYTNPDTDFEIKPINDDTIEFVPSHPSTAVHHSKVPDSAFEIISTFYANPSTKLKIIPESFYNYTIIVTDDDTTQTYTNIKPNDVRLIVDLQADAKLPFNVKPTNDGEVILLLPKTEDHVQNLPIDSTTENIIKKLRKHPRAVITTELDTDGLFTVTIDDTRYRHISPKLLELIVSLITRPELDYKIVPENDGTLSIVVPKESPSLTSVTISNDKIQFINEIRDKHVKKVSVKRNNEGNLDIDFDTPDGKKNAQDIKPDFGQFLVNIVANPKNPFFIYSEGNGFKLIRRVPPSEPSFTGVPKDIFDFVTKNVKNPQLNIEITRKSDRLRIYDIEFFDGKKSIKKITDASKQTTEFIIVLFCHPDSTIQTETEVNGEEIIILKKLDSPIIEFRISPKDVKLIADLSNPNVQSVTVKPGKPDTFDVTIVYIDGTQKTHKDLNKKLLNLVIVIATERKFDVRTYVDGYGKFKVSVPKGAIPKDFKGVKPDFYDFLVKIQPEIDTISYSLTPNNDNDNDFIVVIKTKSHHKTFHNLPSSDILLLTQVVLHPKSKLNAKKQPDGDLIIIVVEKVKKPDSGDGFVLNNVQPKFVQLLGDLKKPDYSLTISRNGDLGLLVGEGKKGLQFSPVDPIIIELIVGVYADPNYHYTAKVDSDGAYTIVVPTYKTHVEFHNINPTVRDNAQALTGASTALLLITRKKDDNKFIVGISTNGGAAEQSQRVHIEVIKFYVLTTIYKNLHLVESTSSSGYITIEITLPRVEVDYDFTQFKVQVKKVDDISKSYGGLFGSILQAAGNLIGGIVHGAASIVEGAVGGVGKVVGGLGHAVGGLLGGIFG